MQEEIIKVLIVEDEGVVALDIQQHLESAGYSVVGSAFSGDQALKEVEEHRPHIILMDIKIRGQIDGIETAGKIYEKYGIPIIFLTAFADDTTLQRAKEIGPFGYIIKPFDERDLKIAIDMALYRYQLEQQLHESEERYKRLFEEDLSGDFVADDNGSLLAVNNSFKKIFELPEDIDIDSINIGDFFPSEETRLEFWELLHQNKRINLQEADLVSAKGKTISVLANVIYSSDRAGVPEIKGYIIDVSERRVLEQQLLQSQKMEAVGRLAGGVAHDFNNILTVIIGYGNLVLDKLSPEEEIGQDVEGILAAASKASSLTRQLLVFSRKHTLNPRLVDAGKLLDDMQKFLNRLLNEDVTLKLYNEAEAATVNIDPSHFEQVIMNLVVNARDAMPDGGRIQIETENFNLAEEVPSIIGPIPPADYVRIKVSDTGVGISKENMPVIFEPFFTTKGKEEGTGLGLSTVYGIIKQSGGFLQVESEKGRGTRFSILFPLASGEAVTVQTDSFHLEKGARDKTILLVEDDEHVRSMLGRTLRRAGYRVFEVSNAGEALLLCEQPETGIDLLVSDVVMPHVSGVKLAERLKKEFPQISILLMSGYPDDVALSEGWKNREIPFISKPFQTSEFLDTVRKLVE